MYYKDAVKKLYEKYTEKPTIMKAIEFDKYFAFMITIPNANKTSMNFVGGDIICVQKKSGEIFKESITDTDFSKAIRFYEDKNEEAKEE